MRTRLVTLVGILFLLAGGSFASAEDALLAGGEVCEPPISVCKGPSLASDALASSVAPDLRRCPGGFACVCVPSCPECDDCAAEVCIPERECDTACDCEPGLACYGGRCLAGVAPVYCCDSDLCPAGEMCQGRDGEFGRCFDPMCEERVSKVQRLIASWVKRASECEASSECVRIDTSTQCRGTCGAFVNEKFARHLASRIDWLDKAVCDSFREDGCPFATPACQQLQPACVQKRCTGVLVLPGPRPRPLDKLDFQRPDPLQHLEANR